MGAHGKADICPLMLRLPRDLHRLLVQAAKKADRSLNAEILWRLGLSFNLERELGWAKSDARFEALRDAVDIVLRQARELQETGPLVIGAGLGFGGGMPGGKGGGLLGDAVAGIKKKGSKKT